MFLGSFFANLNICHKHTYNIIYRINKEDLVMELGSTLDKLEALCMHALPTPVTEICVSEIIVPDVEKYGVPDVNEVLGVNVVSYNPERLGISGAAVAHEMTYSLADGKAAKMVVVVSFTSPAKIIEYSVK